MLFTQLNKIKRFKLSDISWREDSAVVVKISTFLDYSRDSTPNKEVKFYFKQTSPEDKYTIFDSKGLGRFAYEIRFIEFCNKVGAFDGKQQYTDLQLISRVKECEEIRKNFFNSIKQEIHDKLSVKRWTTPVSEENVTHYEHARCTNNTPYTLKNVRYSFQKDIYKYGTKLLTRILKSGESRDFDPYEYAVYNNDKTSLVVIVDDASILDIVYEKEYFGDEYTDYMNNLLQ